MCRYVPVNQEQFADDFYPRSLSPQIQDLGIESVPFGGGNETFVTLTVVTSSFHSHRRAPELLQQWSTQLHNHSLCGDDNQALFGPCLASTGKQLELQLEIAEPIKPGLAPGSIAVAHFHLPALF